MEKIFIDTSALYTIIVLRDNDYEIAISTWENLMKRGDALTTNNYVLMECFALLQSRLGVEAIRQLQLKIVPFLQVDWVGEQQHLSSVNDVFTANRRQLSLVDCSCLESMRRLGIEKVFTFDQHFREQGFEVIP